MKEGVRGEGWVLVSSGIIHSPIFRGPQDIFKLWVVLMCKAHRRKETFRMWDGRQLERGELVTTLAELRELLLREGDVQAGEKKEDGPSRQKIHRYLKRMSEGPDPMISMQISKQRGTLIKIINFDAYQDFDTYTKDRADSQADKRGQPKEQSKRGVGSSKGNVSGQPSGQARTPRSYDSDPPDLRKETSSLLLLNNKDTQGNGLDRMVWNEYERLYREKFGGLFPGHSIGKAEANLASIRTTVLSAAHGRKLSNDDMMKLVTKALTLFFKQKTDFKEITDYSLGCFCADTPKLIKKIKRERL